MPTWSEPRQNSPTILTEMSRLEGIRLEMAYDEGPLRDIGPMRPSDGYANPVADFLLVLTVGLDPNSARIATHEHSNGHGLPDLRTHCRARDIRCISPVFGAFCAMAFYLKRLLTQPEQVLYHRLVKALPNHIVLAQVQVSRVLGVKKGSRVHEWNNRINRLSYDFVICDKAATVIAAIELDDKSHESERRRNTDAKKNKATMDAGLKLVRWQVKSLPDEAMIQREIIQEDAALAALPSMRAER